MIGSTPGRFEYRIWGRDLSAFHDRLAALVLPSESRESSETYILSRATDAANVKIRDDLLDIKVMSEQLGRLERWRPALKAGFPLDSRAIADRIFPSLKMPTPQITRPTYTRSKFINDLIVANGDLWLVDVVKIRRQFTLKDYAAEFADVGIVGGAKCETVAIESEDPATMLRAIAKLGLNSQPNTSYVRHLKMMTGTVPRVSI